MNITCKFEICPEDADHPGETIEIRSHPQFAGRMILTVKGIKVQLHIEDLERAVQCMKGKKRK